MLQLPLSVLTNRVITCLAAGLFASGLCVSADAADLGTIMPMGDSITLGVPVNGGYRDPLYTLLTNRGDTFTFVGSQTGYATDALTAAGQTHHEGHSGYVITNAVAVSRTGLDENLASWIGPSALTPDTILLMIGSNDIDLNYDVANAPVRLNNLINHIYALLPDVRIYLASIIPMSGSHVAREPDVLNYNAAIPGIAAGQRALGRDVIYVPMHDALNAGTDLADGLHPNAQGYQRMAATWDETLHTAADTRAVNVTATSEGIGGGDLFSAGWEFTVDRTIAVTSLGQFDPNGTAVSNSVAIYRKGGERVIEAAIPTNSFAQLSGVYSARYAPIASTVLTAGTYVVVSTQNGNPLIATNGSPSTTFGSAITWNKGVAQDAGPLPDTAPGTWPIEDAVASRYFGPTFTYEEAHLTVLLTSPPNGQTYTTESAVSILAAVTNAAGAYTVHVYTNSGASAFAEAGTGGSASPYQVDLGTLPAGTYHVYATVTDSLSATNSTTNTFTVVPAVLVPGQQILTLTGWNQDIIIGKSEAAPEYTVNMGGWDFYEKGLAGSTLGLPADTPGTNRTFLSSRNPSVKFQFQPYAGSNALYLDGPRSATLTLATPAKFQSLQFLMTTRTMNWYATLNFADGSSTTTPTWSDPDWVTNPGPSDRCLTTYGLRKASDNSFYSSYLWMAQRDFTLAPADQNKTLTSITFTTLSNAGYQLALFAVSGYVLDSLVGSKQAVELLSAGDGAGGGGSYSVGWDFTVTQTIRIKSLGQFDPNGTAVSNTVALYQRGGSKIAEAAILTSSPSEASGNYAARYATVNDLILTNGNYVVFSTQNGDNFISGGGSPEAAFGPGVTWNRGHALASGSAAGPLPASASAGWAITNTAPFRYFGPTFQYELVAPPPTLTLTCPTNTQALSAGADIVVTATVVNAVGAYTVHVYTNGANGVFAEASTGGSASPYAVNIGKLPVGEYHIYATAADLLSSTNTATNAFTVAIQTGHQTVNMTGWNQDIIIGKSETAPGYTVNMAGWDFYERGLSGGTLGLPADVAGTNRTFTSSYNKSVKFQFQPYVGKNALYLTGSMSATLSLVNPARFYSIQMLQTARSLSWYATLNFADGSSTTTTTWTDPDWTATGPTGTCLTTYGLKSTSGNFYTGYLWMADREITLSAIDRAKTLNSVTFTTSGASDKQLAVFAVSGYAFGSSSNDLHAIDLLTAGDGAGGGTSYSVGWDFSVSERITVTSLGQFDPNAAPKTNAVALYRRGGAKLAEVTVYPDSPSELSGNYSTRYVASGNLILEPGDYVVVSTQNGDNFIAPNGNPEATVGPVIIWNKGVALSNGSAAGPLPDTAPATWPIENPNAYRYFGPTFKYRIGAIWPQGTILRIK